MFGLQGINVEYLPMTEEEFLCFGLDEAVSIIMNPANYTQTELEARAS